MATSPPALIGGVYSIDFSHPLEGAAEPATAYAAQGGGDSRVMAIPVARGWPARARVISTLAGAAIRNVLSPFAHGQAVTPSGENGYFIICPAPPGPSLEATLRAWPEPELIEHVVKPAAMALAELQSRGVTHRSIRLSNIFQAAHGTPLILGSAWAAPPASHQPSWVEPAYSAACMPAGRGDGTIADDVYALGAVLLMLTLGFNPVEGIPDETVLRNKLDEGSYAALAGKHRLPASMAELIRGMLADDPEHRPSPALLATPAAARARRIAARPARRAQRPIQIGGQAVYTSRTLAHALQTEPKAGVAAIRSGEVDRWLRRGLGDLGAATELDDAVRTWDAQGAAGESRADPLLIAHSVAALNPSAPLVWRSMALWPDGLGPALDHALHHAPGQVAALTEIATTNVVETWAKRLPNREAALARFNMRDIRSLLAGERGSAIPLRLTYSLNPLTPCESPVVKRLWAIRLVEFLLALEAASATRLPDGQPLVDTHGAAFIAARRDERLHSDIGRLASSLPHNEAVSQLRLVAALQAKLHGGALPHLCAWAADAMQPSIKQFRGQSRRIRLAATLASLAAGGQLPPIAALLDNEQELAADLEACSLAAARRAEVEQALASLDTMQAFETEQARRVGQDIAGGLSAIGCLIAIAFAVFA